MYVNTCCVSKDALYWLVLFFLRSTVFVFCHSQTQHTSASALSNKTKSKHENKRRECNRMIAGASPPPRPLPQHYCSRHYDGVISETNAVGAIPLVVAAAAAAAAAAHPQRIRKRGGQTKQAAAVAAADTDKQGASS
jgi:hypothetical protein